MGNVEIFPCHGKWKRWPEQNMLEKHPVLLNGCLISEFVSAIMWGCVYICQTMSVYRCSLVEFIWACLKTRTRIKTHSSTIIIVVVAFVRWVPCICIVDWVQVNAMLQGKKPRIQIGHHLRTSIEWLPKVFSRLAFLAIHHIYYAVLFIYASDSTLYGNIIQCDNTNAKAILIIWN